MVANTPQPGASLTSRPPSATVAAAARCAACSAPSCCAITDSTCEGGGAGGGRPSGETKCSLCERLSVKCAPPLFPTTGAKCSLCEACMVQLVVHLSGCAPAASASCVAPRCANPAPTSTSMRLNSSKHAHAPACARPRRNLAMKLRGTERQGWWGSEKGAGACWPRWWVGGWRWW